LVTWALRSIGNCDATNADPIPMALFLKKCLLDRLFITGVLMIY
jgi:hypothetical protein